MSAPAANLFASLPDEIVVHIATMLAAVSPRSLFALGAVDSRFRRLVKDDEGSLRHWEVAVDAFAKLGVPRFGRARAPLTPVSPRDPRRPLRATSATEEGRLRFLALSSFTPRERCGCDGASHYAASPPARSADDRAVAHIAGGSGCPLYDARLLSLAARASRLPDGDERSPVGAFVRRGRNASCARQCGDAEKHLKIEDPKLADRLRRAVVADFLRQLANIGVENQ